MSRSSKGKGGRLGVSIGPKNTDLLEDTRDLGPSSFVILNYSVQRFERSKMSRLIRGQGGHIGFPFGPYNTNLAEDVTILLTVKCR